MVGGNLAGATRTVSIEIYDRVQSMDYAGANQIALGLLLFSLLCCRSFTAHTSDRNLLLRFTRHGWRNEPVGTSVKRDLNARSGTAQSFVLDAADFPLGVTIIFGASGAGKSTLLTWHRGIVEASGRQNH